MNKPVDWNSVSIRAGQADPDSPDPQLAEEALDREIEAYIEDWVAGDLVEPPGKDIYYDPIERLTEDAWVIDLLAAKTDEEILAKAKVIRAKLREFLAAQYRTLQ